MSVKKFICDGCGLDWDADMTEENKKLASDECKKNFGVEHHESDAVLCDRCYEQFMAKVKSTGQLN